jgi:hypothetical protein
MKFDRDEALLDYGWIEDPDFKTRFVQRLKLGKGTTPRDKTWGKGPPVPPIIN